MFVRAARFEELAICAAIYQRVLRQTFTWIPAARHNAQDFLNATAQEEVYVAVEDGRILGLAAVYLPGSFLHSLYVAERGRGVGRALLAHVERICPEPVSLKCQAANLRAQAFYRREGLRVVEEGEDLPPGVPWVRMARR